MKLTQALSSAGFTAFALFASPMQCVGQKDISRTLSNEDLRFDVNELVHSYQVIDQRILEEQPEPLRKSDFECGDVIITYPPENVRELMVEYLETFTALFGTGEGGLLLHILIGSVNGLLDNFSSKPFFGVQIRKVCASCLSIREDNEVPEDIFSSTDFNEFCGSDVYGANVLHSGIAAFPVEEKRGTWSIIKTEESIDAFIDLKGLKLSQGNAEIDSLLTSSDGFFSVVATGLGMMTVAPDMSGYGESAGTLVTASLNRRAVATASVPLYFKAKSILTSETGGVTDVSNSAVFYGYSEGGYSSPAAADAFNSIGINPIQVYSGGGPIKTGSFGFVGFMGKLISGNANPFQSLVVALVAIPLSSTIPGVANYEKGQDMLNLKYKQRIIDMFKDPNVPPFGTEAFDYWQNEYGDIMSVVFGESMGLDLLNPAMVDLFTTEAQKNNTDPCSAAGEDLALLCEALKDNDLTDLALNADYRINFCHSPDDELVVIENVPDIFKNLKYLSYTPSMGGHGAGAFPCMIYPSFGLAAVETPTLIGDSKKSKSTKKGSHSKKLKVSKSKSSKKGDKSKEHRSI